MTNYIDDVLFYRLHSPGVTNRFAILCTNCQ